MPLPQLAASLDALATLVDAVAIGRHGVRRPRGAARAARRRRRRPTRRRAGARAARRQQPPPAGGGAARRGPPPPRGGVRPTHRTPRRRPTPASSAPSLTRRRCAPSPRRRRVHRRVARADAPRAVAARVERARSQLSADCLRQIADRPRRARRAPRDARRVRVRVASAAALFASIGEAIGAPPSARAACAEADARRRSAAASAAAPTGGGGVDADRRRRRALAARARDAASSGWPPRDRADPSSRCSRRVAPSSARCSPSEAQGAAGAHDAMSCNLQRDERPRRPRGGGGRRLGRLRRPRRPRRRAARCAATTRRRSVGVGLIASGVGGGGPRRGGSLARLAGRGALRVRDGVGSPTAAAAARPRRRARRPAADGQPRLVRSRDALSQVRRRRGHARRRLVKERHSRRAVRYADGGAGDATGGTGGTPAADEAELGARARARRGGALGARPRVRVARRGGPLVAA